MQGKKDSNDYPDNYCFASAVDGGAYEEIVQNFSTCLVRNNNDILLRLSLNNTCPWFNQRLRVYHLSGPLKKQEFTSTDSKILATWVMILTDFNPFILVGNLFKDFWLSLIVVMAESSQKSSCP